MPDTRTRRGRPKGSGIDDRQRLDAIARLIAANPELKPTTAIRNLGVADPSVIRRLRDKFNLVRQDLISELKAHPHSRAQATTAAGVSSAADPAAASMRSNRSRAMPASAQPAPRLSAHPKSTASSPAGDGARPAREPTECAPPSSATSPKADDDPDRRPSAANGPAVTQALVMSLLGAGMATTNTAIAAQMTFAEQIVKSPYVTLLLRQQLAFNEWAMSLATPRRNWPKTAS